MTHKTQQGVPFHLELLANQAEQEMLRERAELIAMNSVLKERVRSLETALHISQKNVAQAHQLVISLAKKSAEDQKMYVESAASFAMTLDQIKEETKRTDGLLKILCARFFEKESG